MARCWLAQNEGRGQWSGHGCLRLDVIGVLLSPDGSLLRLDHVESAF
jgi:hypothetical protein